MGKEFRRKRLSEPFRFFVYLIGRGVCRAPMLGNDCPCHPERRIPVHRNQKGARKRRQQLRTWTYQEAQAAAPYITSIMRSLREHYLEAQSQHRQARLIGERPGRLDRTARIVQEEATRAAAQAEDRFQHALDELQTLDVYCLDPLQGLALIPFVHDEQLAWFVFDLFDAESLRFWRDHEDPLEKRRPVSDLQDNRPVENTRLA
jgi:hypothetical protein